METRANPVLVGAFTIFTIVAGFVFAFWAAGVQDTGDTTDYRIIFSDEVSGLSNGSPVQFNGIGVGSVVDINFAQDDPTQVEALIRVSQDTPIKVDTTAQLQSQGITGISFIQLRSGRPDAQDLITAWGEDSPPIIYAERSAFANVVDGIQTAVTRVEDAAVTLSQILTDNQASIDSTIKNIDTFSQALADSSDEIRTFLTDASSAARRLDTLGAQVENLTQIVEEQLADIEPGAIGRTVDNIERFSTALADNSGRITMLVEDATSAARQINVVARRLEDVADNAVEISAAIDPDSVARTVASVEEFSTGLASRTQTVETMIDDAASIAAQLRGTAERVDTIVARIDGMVGEGNESFFQDVASAARAFRELSENLDSQVGALSGDLSRAVDQSSQDFNALVADGRRTLDSIDRILRDLQSSPSRFLTGRGGSVPEHTPRR